MEEKIEITLKEYKRLKEIDISLKKLIKLQKQIKKCDRDREKTQHDYWDLIMQEEKLESDLD